MHLVDTTDSEAKSTALDARPIHVVSNQKNKLHGLFSQKKTNKKKEVCLTLSSSLKCWASKSERPAAESFLAP